MVVAEFPGKVPVRAEVAVEVVGSDETTELAGKNGDAATADIGDHFLEHGGVCSFGDARVCNDDRGRRLCGEVGEGTAWL